jgi:hypothetical protein
MSQQNVEIARDQVVVVTHQTATGRESGVPVELKLWQLADIKDGRLIRVSNYLTAAEAREAAGLSGTGTSRFCELAGSARLRVQRSGSSSQPDAGPSTVPPTTPCAVAQ